MKIFGLDTDKHYTDEELAAAVAHAEERCDFWCRQVVLSTMVLVTGMIVGTFIYHMLHMLLGLGKL